MCLVFTKPTIWKNFRFVLGPIFSRALFELELSFADSVSLEHYVEYSKKYFFQIPADHNLVLQLTICSTEMHKMNEWSM